MGLGPPERRAHGHDLFKYHKLSVFICVHLWLPPWLLDPADRQVLDLEEVVDAVLGAFAAQARLLHAAEGRDLVGEDADVDADHARLDRFGDAEDAAHVARIEIRGEAE